ncbi:MAG: peptidylprolyl isomerase [Armatimonadota bacterium]
MRIRNLLLAAILLVAFSNSVFAQNAEKKQTDFDQKAVLEELWLAPDDAIVGTVNGEKVTKRELLKMLWFWNAPAALQELLNQKMIQQEAKKARVELDWAEVVSKKEETLTRMNAATLEELLYQYNITWWRYMSTIKTSALVEKVVKAQIQIPDTELAQYINASHILISYPQDITDQAQREEAAKNAALEIKRMLDEGADFTQLANEKSQDPGNVKNGEKQGGNLGWFNRGRMVPEFDEAAFSLKSGEISEPVKSQFGYHIIKVNKIGKDANENEKKELKAMIAENKMQIEMPVWFNRVQKNAKIVNKLMPPPIQQPEVTAPPARPVPPKTTAPPPPPAPVDDEMDAPPAPAPPAEKPMGQPEGDKQDEPPVPPAISADEGQADQPAAE